MMEEFLMFGSGFVGALLSILILFLALLLVILYIVTLIRQARKKEWEWFVITLLISPTMFVYWIYKLIKFGGVLK